MGGFCGMEFLLYGRISRDFGKGQSEGQRLSPPGLGYVSYRGISAFAAMFRRRARQGPSGPKKENFL